MIPFLKMYEQYCSNHHASIKVRAPVDSPPLLATPTPKSPPVSAPLELAPCAHRLDQGAQAGEESVAVAQVADATPLLLP